MPEATLSTLQAVKAHEKCDVFDAPGEMDLSAHVDFATLDAIARREGVASSLTTQGAWLTAMGIGLRAQALAKASPARAEDIRLAHDRLVQPDAMGEEIVLPISQWAYVIKPPCTLVSCKSLTGCCDLICTSLA